MPFPLPRLAAALLLGAALAAGAAEPPPPAAEPPAPLRPGAAQLGRLDGFGGKLPAYREVVDRAGQIELPYLGMVDAAGKSIPAVEAEMAAAYAHARLSTDAVVRLTFIAHFSPAPERSELVRAHETRRPVPAAEAFPLPAP